MDTPQHSRISAPPKHASARKLEAVLYAETHGTERDAPYNRRARHNRAGQSFELSIDSMIKFIKGLFGGANHPSTEPTKVKAEGVEYKGYLITASPIVESGQYRTCGSISHTAEDGQQRQSQYIRADNHSSEQQAIDHAISKGKQVIDERGEALFASERC